MRTALMTLMLTAGALAVATSTYADPVTLSGTVVDESGTPIADAEVFAVSFDYDAWEATLAGSARTDAEGRFAIPGVEFTLGAVRFSLNVAALAEGRALGWTTVQQQATTDLRVVCAEPAPISGRVTDEAGEGVAARITATYVSPPSGEWPRTEPLFLPDDLAQRLSVDCDADGRFALVWPGPGARVRATVAAPGLGIIEKTFRAGESAEITLLPAATLRGRVVCPDAPEAVAGLEVRVRGYDRERSFSWSGEAQTDAEGRFETVDLHPGPTDVSIRFAAEAQWQAPGQAVELAPGETAEVEIALARTYLLTGRVVDEVTGAPIEGVRVYVSPTPAGEVGPIAPTDAEGRYRLRVLPGRTVVCPIGGQGYFSPEYGTKNAVALVTDRDVELPDIALKPGVTVKGRVVDAAGEPVADAEVLSSTAQALFVHPPLRTNERGEFAIEDVDPDRSFTVCARKGEAMTAAAVSVDPRAGDELLLQIREGAGVRLAVRVVDAEGAPVEGAEVNGYWRAEMFGTYLTLGTTDADGRLVSEPQWPNGTYSVTATAPGCDQAQSADWTAVSGETHDFGELVLVRATGFVAGRVVDGSGQPVAGATVFNSGDGPARVETQTDTEGRFRLEGLYPGGACVIAQTETLFGGALVEVGAEDAVITVTPEPEVTLGEPIVIAPLTDEATDRAAALELIEEMLGRPPEELGDVGDHRARFVAELAKLDAERAFAISDQEGGEYEDTIIRALGQSLLREDPDQALAWIEGLGNPTARGFAMMRAVRTLAEIDPERARAELEALIPQAPEMGEPTYRAVFLARCGETLYRLDPEAAEPVIRQAEEIAKTLPVSDRDAYARGVVAEALCHFDLDGALALIANLRGDNEPTRHQPNIAARIAADNPAKAAELLGALDDWQRGRATARVAYAMAPAHPDEALALARTVTEGYQQARALGYVALALRESDPARAGEVFGEAVALLAKQPRSTDTRQASAMAELAHIGAQMGYAHTERLVWRAIALRPAPSQEPGAHNVDDAAYLSTLAFVAPAVTRELIRAEVARNPPAEAAQYSSATQSLLNAAVACDARLALELALSLPHDNPADEYPQYASYCLQVVQMLLTPREQRFIEIAARYGGWVPGADVD